MAGFNVTGITPTAAKTAAEALPGEATVTMLFPHAVNLTHDVTRQVIKFTAGVNEVPESLADHAWLRANGVRAHIKPRPQPLQLTPAILTFLQSKGYAKDGTAAEQYEAGQKFLDGMSLEDQRGFMADFTQNSGGPQATEGVTPPPDPNKLPTVQEGVTPPPDPKPTGGSAANDDDDADDGKSKRQSKKK